MWVSAILPKEDKSTMIITYSDISQLRKAEQALNDSEVRFQSIVESAQDIFVVSDLEKGNTFVSPSFKTNHRNRNQ